MIDTHEYVRRRPVVVASHPRSGTHTVIDFLRKNFSSTASWRFWGLSVEFLFLNLDTQASSRQTMASRAAEKIFARPQRPLIKTHLLSDLSQSWAEYESQPLPERWRQEVERALVIYVSRDPIPVMKSYRNFMAHLYPEYGQMPLIAFCKTAHWSGDTDRLGWWARHVSGWLDRPGVVHVNYDYLLRDPHGVLARLAPVFEETPREVDDPLPVHLKTITQARLSRLMHLSPESTAVVARPAQGIVPVKVGAEETAYFDEAVGTLRRRIAETTVEVETSA